MPHMEKCKKKRHLYIHVRIFIILYTYTNTAQACITDISVSQCISELSSELKGKTILGHCDKEVIILITFHVHHPP